MIVSTMASASLRGDLHDAGNFFDQIGLGHVRMERMNLG